MSTPRTGSLLTAPVLPLVLRLATPNALSLGAATAVSIAETAYIGALGVPALAGLALVFPLFMLMQTMSAGAMGGGVASAIARALGANDAARATALKQHAIVIALVGGVIFTLVFLLFGEVIFRALGGDGEPLAQALAYSNIVFAGAILIWLTNTLAATLRGAGDMRAPALAMLIVAGLQVLLGGGLGLGIGPLPRWGMQGVALGSVLANLLAGAWLMWFQMSRARAPLTWRGFRPRRDLFADILKVGAVALISPLQTIATVLVLTRLMAFFGPSALAGYGIGARLEFLLIPITFAIGAACIPLVGMAIGAGNIARARKIAWTGGGIGAGLAGLIGLLVALAPRCGRACSAPTPACWLPPMNICASPGRRLCFSASGTPSISRRRARAKSGGPCWRARCVSPSSRLAAGGWRSATCPRGACSRSSPSQCWLTALRVL